MAGTLSSISLAALLLAANARAASDPRLLPALSSPAYLHAFAPGERARIEDWLERIRAGGALAWAAGLSGRPGQVQGEALEAVARAVPGFEPGRVFFVPFRGDEDRELLVRWLAGRRARGMAAFQTPLDGGLIFVDADLPPKHLRATLVHEWLHAREAPASRVRRSLERAVAAGLPPGAPKPRLEALLRLLDEGRTEWRTRELLRRAGDRIEPPPGERAWPGPADEPAGRPAERLESSSGYRTELAVIDPAMRRPALASAVEALLARADAKPLVGAFGAERLARADRLLRSRAGAAAVRAALYD